MNWHLSSQSSIWRLDEGDYLIHLGRRYWDRRDENGEYTRGNAVIPRTQPAQHMRGFAHEGGYPTREFTLPRGGMGRTAFARMLIRSIDEREGVNPNDDEFSLPALEVKDDAFRRNAKKHTAIAMANVAAASVEANAAHAEWLTRNRLNDPEVPTFAPHFLRMAKDYILPAYLQRTTQAFEMVMTADMILRVKAKAYEIKVTPSMRRDIAERMRAEAIVSVPSNRIETAKKRIERRLLLNPNGPKPGFAQARVEGIEDLTARIRALEEFGKELESLRGIKPSDEGFVDEVERFSKKHNVALEAIGADARTITYEAKVIAATRELANDPAFFLEPIANTILGSWATSSWNGKMSWLVQELARTEFSVENGFSGGLPREVIDNELRELSHDSPTALGAVRSLVRAMYAITQEVLSDNKVESLMLFRGVRDQGIKGQRLFKDGDATVSMGPLSSWSVDSEKAGEFAGDRGHLLVATVPRERIVAIPTGGIGCAFELEVVIAGGDLDVSVIDLMENTVKHSPRTPRISSVQGEGIVATTDRLM